MEFGNSQPGSAQLWSCICWASPSSALQAKAVGAVNFPLRKPCHREMVVLEKSSLRSLLIQFCDNSQNSGWWCFFLGARMLCPHFGHSQFLCPGQGFGKHHGPAQFHKLLLSPVALSPSVWNSRAMNIQRDKCVKKSVTFPGLAGASQRTSFTVITNKIHSPSQMTTNPNGLFAQWKY